MNGMGSKKRKAIIDDGFNPELVEGASFCGLFGIPLIEAPHDNSIPEGFTTFTQRHRAPTNREALCSFEQDREFAEVLIEPSAFVDEFNRFFMFVPTDCSVYRNAPLAVQIGNIYKSRAIGSYYQRHGSNVWPLVRWGDERTYTTSVLPEKVAFAGIEHGSPVVISGYGCMAGVDNKVHFRAGLEAMMDTVEPSIVLVYGPMPDRVFRGVLNHAEFINFPDWTSRMKGRD